MWTESTWTYRPSFCILCNCFLIFCSKYLYKAGASSWCRQSQLNTEPRIQIKSRFLKCSFRSPLQLMHCQPNSNAFGQTTSYTQYSGKIWSWGEGQNLPLCSILNATWYSHYFLLLLVVVLLFLEYQTACLQQGCITTDMRIWTLALQIVNEGK